MEEHEWDAVIHVHLKGHFAPTRHAAAYWRERAKAGEEVRARVINTSSPSGVFGNVGQANYGAAKAGIVGFTLIAAQELGRYGVTVNAIAPNARTRMTEAAFGSIPAPEDGFDPADPGNNSPIVVALCADEAQSITGQVFFVYGGAVNLLRGWEAGELFAQRGALGPGRAARGAARPAPGGRGPRRDARVDAPRGRPLDARGMTPLGRRNLARLAEEAFERRGDYRALWFEGEWHRLGGRARARGPARGRPRRARRPPRRPGRRADGELARRARGVRGDLACGRGRHPGDLPAHGARGRAPGRRLRARRSSSPRPRSQTRRAPRRARCPWSTTLAELEADEPAPIVAARRRRPGRAPLHRRHDRPLQGRDADAREPLGGRPARTRRRARGRVDRSLTCAAARARLRAARDWSSGSTPARPPVSALMRWFDAARLARARRRSTASRSPPSSRR